MHHAEIGLLGVGHGVGPGVGPTVGPGVGPGVGLDVGPDVGPVESHPSNQNMANAVAALEEQQSIS